MRRLPFRSLVSLFHLNSFFMQRFTSRINMADEKHSDALDHVDEKAEKLKDIDTSLHPVDDQDDPVVKRIKRKVDFRLSAILAVRLWYNSNRNRCANNDCQLTSCSTASTKSTAQICQMRKNSRYPSTTEQKAYSVQPRCRHGRRP